MRKEKHKKVNRNGNTVFGEFELFRVTSPNFLLEIKNKFLLLVIFTLLLSSLNSPVAAKMGPIPNIGKTTKLPKIDVPFDLDALKTNWRNRIKTIKDSGRLPIIDIESSYNPKKLNANKFAKMMDKHGIALIAFSPQVGKKEFKKGKLWSDHLRRLIGVDPWRFIPTTTAGIYPAWTEKPEDFLNKQIQRVKEDGYPLMGEFEFRHYPSPRQYKRGEMFRDVNILISA